jgi:hypothetical protein
MTGLTSLCRGHVAGIEVQLNRHYYAFSRNEKQLTYCLASSRYIGIIFPLTTPGFGLQYQSVIDLGVDLRPANLNNNGTVTGSCKTGAPACPDAPAACLAILQGSISSP